MQDVSIQDLTERLKIIEGQGRRESEFLNEIKVCCITLCAYIRRWGLEDAMRESWCFLVV